MKLIIASDSGSTINFDHASLVESRNFTSWSIACNGSRYDCEV